MAPRMLNACVVAASAAYTARSHFYPVEAIVSLLLLQCLTSYAQLTCPTRSCLPEDTAQRVATNTREGTKLCYTATSTAEAFARCPGGVANKCVKCSREPPCESWCEEDNYTPKKLGEPCHFDSECGSELAGFASCHLGLCRRVVWTGQRCDESDVLGVCLFGAQVCARGRCSGLGANQPCWDGYPDGRDLDCQVGWYCLRGICVPQLPSSHTCYGEHAHECIRGHKCNLAGKRPQCTEEYSLKIGMRASSPVFCESSHISPRMEECSPVPPVEDFGKDCTSDEDCLRSDNSGGNCVCKQWWDGTGAPGFCEIIIPERMKPSFMEFWRLHILKCHHSWPAERCALELGEHSLYLRVREESQASADPTLIEECAYDVLEVVKSSTSSIQLQSLALLLVVATTSCLYDTLHVTG